jgi:hypothetical protein
VFAIAKAVPVYVDAEGQIAVYRVATVNVSDIESNLGQIGGDGSHILLFERNGTWVDCTRKAAQETEIKSFGQLQGVKNALSGQAGTIV